MQQFFYIAEFLDSNIVSENSDSYFFKHYVEISELFWYDASTKVPLSFWEKHLTVFVKVLQTTFCFISRISLLSFSEGFYLLADSSQYPYNTIQTRSRQFPKTRGTKLTFDFFMHGTAVRDLSVLIEYAGVSKEMFIERGSQGRKWNRADIVYFSPTTYNVRIIYIASIRA